MKIHDLPDGKHVFHCPACGCGHFADDRWSFNGDYNNPTFSPSILVNYLPDSPGPRCHSFVTDGKIHFLSDCSHELAGQTIEIPDWDE